MKNLRRLFQTAARLGCLYAPLCVADLMSHGHRLAGYAVAALVGVLLGVGWPEKALEAKQA